MVYLTMYQLMNEEDMEPFYLSSLFNILFRI